jgi:hypothetical protein
MTEEKKEMSEAEKAKAAEEARASNVKKTLESKLFQNTLGSNLVKTSPNMYGELGYQSASAVYDSTMASKEANEVKTQLYQEKLAEGKAHGVVGEPAYPSNYDLSLKLVQQIEEVMNMAKLSELETAVKGAGAKIGFEIPESLKDYIAGNLMKKAYDELNGKLDISKLSEDEKNALGVYQALTEYYKRACALKTVQANYFADLDSQGKQIAELYKKKAEENK